MGDATVQDDVEKASTHHRPSRRMLTALAAVGAATLAQLYFPQALIPAISRDFGVSAADAALTVSGASIGLAVSVLGWSWIADRFGRAPVMRIALLSAAVLGLLIPWVPSFDALVAIRVLQGVALGGTPALALTYVSEEVGRRDAMVAAATYISGTVVGGLLGRLLAAPVAALFDWRAGALVVGIMSALTAVLAAVLLPTARNFRRATRDGPGWGLRGSPLWLGVAASLRNRGLLVLYAQAFLLMGAHVAVYNYLGYRLELAPFGLPPEITAAIFLAGLSGAVSARLAARLAGRYGRRRALLLSSAVMAGGAALTIVDWLPTVLIGFVIFTAAYFSAHSIASGWVGLTATTGTAQATSLYTLFYYAGSSLFGWLGGLAFTLGWAGTATMVIVIVLVAFATVFTQTEQATRSTRRRVPPVRPA